MLDSQNEWLIILLIGVTIVAAIATAQLTLQYIEWWLEEQRLYSVFLWGERWEYAYNMRVWGAFWVYCGAF